MIYTENTTKNRKGHLSSLNIVAGLNLPHAPPSFLKYCHLLYTEYFLQSKNDSANAENLSDDHWQ